MAVAEADHILVVDDERELTNALVEALCAQGYRADGFTSGTAALAALQTQEFDLLLTDLMMPGMDGMALLKAAAAIDPNLVGVIMTGQGTVPTAVEAMKIGAFDYLLKPFRLDTLLPLVARAAAVRQLRLENIQLRETVGIYGLSQVIAFSLDSRQIVEKIVDAAAQQTEADEVSLLLVTPAGDELVVAAVRGDDRASLLHQRVSFEQGVAGWVARQAQPLILNGEVRDARFAPVRPRLDIRSAISLPLVTAGKLVGVLNVNRLRRGRPYTPGQVKALSILTTAAAAALRSARLFEEAESLRDYNTHIVETMGDGLALQDGQGRITFANARLLNLLGYAANELIGQPWHAIVPRREHSAAAELSTRQAAGESVRYESALLTRDSREIPVLVSTTPFDPPGRGGGLLATFTDLTERKRAEAALSRNEQRFRSMIENGSDLIEVLDEAGIMRYQSPSVERLLGYRPDELLGQPAISLVHPDDLKVTLGLFAHNIRHPGARVAAQIRMRHKDGSWRLFDGLATAYQDENGQPAALINARDVTQQRQMETALARTNDLLSRAEQIGHIGSFLRDYSAGGVAWSDGMYRLLGLPPQATGASLPDFLQRVVPDDREQVRQTIEAAPAARGALGFEYRVARPDGQTRVLETRAEVLRDERGQPAVLVGLVTDITDRKQAEQTLARTYDVLSRAEKVGHVGSWERDALSGQETWSDGLYRLLGLAPRQQPSTLATFLGRIHPADQERVRQAIAEATARQTPLEYECRVVHSGGQVRTINWRTENVNDEQGRLLRATGIGVDITERKQAEQDLRKEKERLQQYLDVAGVMFLVTAADETVTALNKKGCEILGYPEHAITGRNWIDVFIPAAERDRARVAFRRLLAGEVEQIEYFDNPVLTRGGEARLVAWHNALLTDEAGRPIGVVSSGEDVTERRRVEQALAGSEAELRALFSAMTDVVLVLDGHGRYLQVAPTNPSLLVRAPNEVLGRTLHEVMPAAEADSLARTIRLALAKQQPIGVEYQLVVRGVPLWFEATVSPLADDRVIWVARDVSERKRRQREMEAIAAVATALRGAASRAEMLPIVLDQTMLIVEATSAAVFSLGASMGELVVELARGGMAGLDGLRLPQGSGISGHVLASGQPYATPDAQADPFFFDLHAVDPARAVAGVPLIAEQRPLGVLWAGRAWPFGADEVRVLGAIANIAGNALHRAALQEQTEQRLQRLAALRAVDLAITANLDLRVTLNVLLDHVTAQLRADGAVVLLMNRHTHLLEFAAGRGLRGETAGRLGLRLGQGYAGRAALERRVLSLPDLAAEPPGPSREALLAGQGLRAYHGAPLIAKGQVLGVLEVFHHSPQPMDPDWLDFLEALAGQAAIAIDSMQLFNDLQHSNLELGLAYEATIEGWSRALDLRDKETEGHTQRVTEMALRLARDCNLREDELVQLRRGALLHDIGKMGVPDRILLKPGPLTDDEWINMKQHPQLAYEMLSPISYLRRALDIPYCHHEKWDGTGYPRGLKGETIPLAARIFAVADVWDALCSDRPYRPAWPQEKVRAYIHDLAGQHFDPNIVEVFEGLLAADDSAPAPDDPPLLGT